MVIYGKEIVLRAIEDEDNELLYSIMNDPETERMLGGSSKPISREEQSRWFSRHVENDSALRCIIALKSDNQALGTVILSDIDQKNGVAEIHIKLAKSGSRGKGYGTDAVNTMVKYAFDEMRLNCIYANILSYNQISAGLFEKCGFQREGVLRDRVFKGGRYIDLISYSIINRR